MISEKNKKKEGMDLPRFFNVVITVEPSRIESDEV